MVPILETSYLARAGKHEFLNLVPDIEEMRPGWEFWYTVADTFNFVYSILTRIKMSLNT